MNKDFYNILRIANRMFWMFFLCLKSTDIACLILSTIVARVLVIAKVPLSAKTYEDLFVLAVILLQIILIFIFAEKFMNLIRRPFKKFYLKAVNPKAKTKIVDRITAYLTYFSLIFSGSFAVSENVNTSSLTYVLISYLVTFPTLYLACILLTKFIVLKKYMICST